MENKRQTIIRTAAELFSQDGFHAVGVDRIIEVSGVAKMTMYRHFGSKDELVAEVLKERDAQRTQSLHTYVARFDTPFARLRAIFEWHEQWFNSQNLTGCLFAHAAAEFQDKSSDIHQITQKQKESFVDFLEAELLALTGKQAAKKLSRTLVMLLDGATLDAQILGRKNAVMDAWASAQYLIPRQTDK